MNKKKLSYFVISVFWGCSLFLFLLKYEIKIYIGDSTPSSYSGVVDVEVKIDGVLILQDTLSANPYLYKEVSKKMRYGFHKVEIVSDKANIYQQKTIFLFFNQHIFIEFFPDNMIFFSDDLEPIYVLNSQEEEMTRSYFGIRTRFNPYYLN